MSRSAPASLASQRQHHALALALACADKPWEVPPPLAASDLELHLLQALGDSLAGSYAAVKRTSQLARAVANAAEDLASSSGLAALVARLKPWVRAADDALGKRVLEIAVSVLLLSNVQGDAQHQQLLLRDSVEQHPGDLEGSGVRTARESDALGRLSHRERIRALLCGELPRVQALLEDARRRERDAVAEQQRLEHAPIVMELKDFVPLDEVKRMKDANRELLLDRQRELATLREKLSALEREKQRLEQDLSDVHSYQESERGRRFLEMEEELARTKLDASQKTYNLRKLEVVVETLRRKRKSKGAKSETGQSATTSDGGDGFPSHGASAV